MKSYSTLDSYPKFVVYSEARDKLIQLVSSSTGEEKDRLISVLNEIINLRIIARVEAMKNTTYPPAFFGLD